MTTLITLKTCFYICRQALSTLAIVFVSTIIFCNGNSLPEDSHLFGVTNYSLIKSYLFTFKHKLIASSFPLSFITFN